MCTTPYPKSSVRQCCSMSPISTVFTVDISEYHCRPPRSPSDTVRNPSFRPTQAVHSILICSILNTYCEVYILLQLTPFLTSFIHTPLPRSTSAKGARYSECHPYSPPSDNAAQFAAMRRRALERLALVGNGRDATQSSAVHRRRSRTTAVHRVEFATHKGAPPHFRNAWQCILGVLDAPPEYGWSS